MAQYISKSALVAEIEKRMLRYEQERKTEPAYYDGLYTALEDLRDDFINTLEVKEVDLEKEMDKEWNKCEPIDEGMGLEIASIEHEQFDNIATHFFELALSLKNS